MEREFYNLNNMHGMGFCRYPHYIACPHKKGAKEYLFQKLTALAYFLATLHNRTANGIGVNFGMAGDALINTGDAQS